MNKRFTECGHILFTLFTCISFILDGEIPHVQCIQTKFNVKKIEKTKKRSQFALNRKHVNNMVHLMMENMKLFVHLCNKILTDKMPNDNQIESLLCVRRANEKEQKRKNCYGNYFCFAWIVCNSVRFTWLRLLLFFRRIRRANGWKAYVIMMHIKCLDGLMICCSLRLLKT